MNASTRIQPTCRDAAATYNSGMSSSLRKALLWLAILVIPLQGMAAAGMAMLPMTSHEAAVTTSMSDMSGAASHADPDQHPKPTPCADRLSGCKNVHGPGAMNCALSAACAITAGPVMATVSVLATGAGSTPTAMGARTRVAFLTGAPDRPPRSLI